VSGGGEKLLVSNTSSDGGGKKERNKFAMRIVYLHIVTFLYLGIVTCYIFLHRRYSRSSIFR
jgi:hypothetical protein